MADVNISFGSDDLKKILDDLNKALDKLSKKEIIGPDDATNAKKLAAEALKVDNALKRATTQAEKLNQKEKELLKELAEQPNFKSVNIKHKGFFGKFGL